MTFVFICGALIGIIPAIYGGIKGKLALGIGGFLATAVSLLLFGIFLAIPVAAIFVWLIAKQVKKEEENTDN